MRHASFALVVLTVVISLSNMPLCSGAEQPGGFPEPVVNIDFDKGRCRIQTAERTFTVKHVDVLRDKGIAGSGCFDVTLDLPGKTIRPLVIHEPAVFEAIQDNWSFTVTGWAKVDFDATDRTNKCVLNCPGRFKVVYNGKYQGLGDMVFEGKPRREVSTGWFGPLHSEKDQWVFFGFSYDGTSKENNAKVYFGSEFEEVSVDEYNYGQKGHTTPDGQVNQKDAKKIIIGALDEKGTEPFDGLLDNIRIFAGSDKTGANALTLQQAEAVRKADLGQRWLKKIARDKISKERQKWERDRELQQLYFSGPVNAVQTDNLSAKFTSITPEPAKQQLHVPRRATLPLTFAVMSRASSLCEITVSDIKDAKGNLLKSAGTIYFLKPVPVEANNNGGIRSYPGLEPPNTWKKYLIGTAPFDISEVMIRTDKFSLTGGLYNNILLDLTITSDAVPGEYRGTITFETSFNAGGYSTTVPFSFIVHKTVLPDKQMLDVVHWLQPAPKDLVYGTQIPDWWSQRHWELLEIAARQLRAFGNNAVWTPLLNGKQPLIKTIRKKDGSYEFDFAGFDRWVELFTGLGYDYIDGRHAKEMWYWPEPFKVFDEAKAKYEPMFKVSSQDEGPWLKWLPVFFKALHQHLSEKGWIDIYRQCLYDEPGSNKENYKKYADILHKYMPGVKSKDALGELELYYGLSDIAVPALTSIEVFPREVKRREQGGYKTELYHCCSPYPPNPNRHMDEPPFGSRLMPWFCYKFNATGYLFWAANNYRGADPYKGSLGPIGPGRLSPPMHCPGDNWFFYPTPEGLVPGYRNVIFRDGLIDYALLKLLSQKDKAAADKIMEIIARDTLDFAREAAIYHRARKLLLEELERF